MTDQQGGPGPGDNPFAPPAGPPPGSPPRGPVPPGWASPPGWAQPPYPGQPYGGPPPYPGQPYPTPLPHHSGAPWPGQYYGGPPRADSTNPWSIVALVTGVVVLFPVAITAGIVALVQIRNRPERGKGMAVAGIVLGSCWAVFAGLVAIGLVLGIEAEGGDLGRVADAGSTKVGTCLLAPGEDRSVGTVVRCSEQHDAEIYEVGALPDGTWPGYDAVWDQSDETCFDTFAGYVGTSYDDSAYDYGWFSPDEADWQDGERRVVCVVVPFDDDLPRRSVQGSGD